MSAARRMLKAQKRRAKWLGMFRPTKRLDGSKVRVQGTPVASKRQQKRDYLAAAQAINPAIRTLNGAKKLDQRLTREAKAGAA